MIPDNIITNVGLTSSYLFHISKPYHSTWSARWTDPSNFGACASNSPNNLLAVLSWHTSSRFPAATPAASKSRAILDSSPWLSSFPVRFPTSPAVQMLTGQALQAYLHICRSSQLLMLCLSASHRICSTSLDRCSLMGFWRRVSWQLGRAWRSPSLTSNITCACSAGMRSAHGCRWDKSRGIRRSCCSNKASTRTSRTSSRRRRRSGVGWRGMRYDCIRLVVLDCYWLWLSGFTTWNYSQHCRDANRHQPDLHCYESPSARENGWTLSSVVLNCPTCFRSARLLVIVSRVFFMSSPICSSLRVSCVNNSIIVTTS